MNEISTSDVQLIGTSDATKKVGEVPPNEEVVLSAEQKQVVGVMQSAGKELEGAELDAREKAAGELKKLQGKELVDAGLKQMGHGVWQTLKSQAKWAVGGGVMGGLGIGLIGGSTRALMNQNNEFREYLFNRVDDEHLYAMGLTRDDTGPLGAAIKQSTRSGAIAGAQTGEAIGFQTAGFEYNKYIATKNNLPPVKWYDWVISNVGLTGLKMLVDKSSIGSNYKTAEGIIKFALSDLFNPITVAGARAVGKGLWEMRKG